MKDALSLDLKIHKSPFALSAQMDIPANGITCIMGPSGSGKTSVLRTIAGLEHHSNCTVQFQQTIWQNHGTFVPTHQRPIGYVFQEPSLFSHLNVNNNLKYGWKRSKNQPLTPAQVAEVLGLENLLTRYEHQLSGGQKQRVALGRALLSNPSILLMDEPLASLDAASKEEILPYLERLHANLSIPIVYVTHSLEEIMRLADHLILLDKGQVVAAGAANSLLTNTELPLAQLEQAGAVINGEVQAHEPEFHLSHLKVAGGHIAISQQNIEIGAEVRVRVLARDVSIALAPAAKTSITNALQAVVSDIKPCPDPAQVMVQLDLGGLKLLSRITLRSKVQLKIEPGLMVYAQIKSASLIRSI